MIRCNPNSVLNKHPELVAVTKDGYVLNEDGLKELDTVLHGIQVGLEDVLPPMLELLPEELEPAGDRFAAIREEALHELAQFQRDLISYRARRNDE